MEERQVSRWKFTGDRGVIGVCSSLSASKMELRFGFSRDLWQLDFRQDYLPSCHLFLSGKDVAWISRTIFLFDFDASNLI